MKTSERGWQQRIKLAIGPSSNRSAHKRQRTARCGSRWFRAMCLTLQNRNRARLRRVYLPPRLEPEP